jgi:hypothetical protein
MSFWYQWLFFGLLLADWIPFDPCWVYFRCFMAFVGGNGKELRLRLRLKKVLRWNVVHMDSAERSAKDAASSLAMVKSRITPPKGVAFHS